MRRSSSVGPVPGQHLRRQPSIEPALGRADWPLTGWPRTCPVHFVFISCRSNGTDCQQWVQLLMQIRGRQLLAWHQREKLLSCFCKAGSMPAQRLRRWPAIEPALQKRSSLLSGSSPHTQIRLICPGLTDQQRWIKKFYQPQHPLMQLHLSSLAAGRLRAGIARSAVELTRQGAVSANRSLSN